MTIDLNVINKRGPAKFRTKSGNPEQQQCYLNICSNDKKYNMYLSKRFLNKDFVTGKKLLKIYWKDRDQWTVQL